ncbi:UPF0481 protein At3g47200-like [Aristolochia californica]|uniref:UPF0481 protein At3g47200-like n=1 Tax=Aristolochia californica TaxID=171875 RepID=UPI0035E30AD2
MAEAASPDAGAHEAKIKEGDGSTSKTVTEEQKPETKTREGFEIVEGYKKEIASITEKMAEVAIPDAGAHEAKIGEGYASTSKTATEEKKPETKTREGFENVEGYKEELMVLAETDLKALDEPSDVRDKEATVYKVPDIMRDGDEKTYSPVYFPVSARYARNSEHIFNDMRREHYFFHLHSVLSRNRSKTLQDYLLMVHTLKDEIRHCYAFKETVKLDFKRLMCVVINSCFIVDLFLTLQEGKLTPDRDLLCAHRRIHVIWIDLLMVENQLPFFLLERVFDMVVTDKSLYSSFVDHCLSYFDQFLEINMKTAPMESASVHHLLHLVHHHLLPLKPQNPSKHKLWKLLQGIIDTLKKLRPSCQLPQLPISDHSPQQFPLVMRTIPTASRLREAGVKFRKKETRGFSHVTFSRGVLEIAPLKVRENTKTLLKNLIAWEQLHRAAGTYFTCYGIFMESIVDTPDDVEILRRSGIIENSTGSNEMVCSIFKGLSRNIFTGFEDNFLPQMDKDLNEYCNNSFNIQWMKLKKDYFGSPWSSISLFAAAILLSLTMIQTYFTVRGYFRAA